MSNGSDPRASLRDLVSAPPPASGYDGTVNDFRRLAGSDLPTATVERLRHAGDDLRAAEAHVYAALHHGNTAGIASGIAHAKAALDHLVSIR